MLWLAIVFPEWPLQALFRGYHSSHAVAVAAGQRVLALDAAALAQGVRAGQRLADALALAPDLQIRPRDVAAEAAALQDIAGALLRFTPHVYLDQHGLLLEVAGSLKLFGGLDALRRKIRDSLSAGGFIAHMACAPTARAAHWLALGQPGSTIRSRDDLSDALAGLPCSVLQIDSTALDLLRSAGLHTLGDAMRLPRDALALRDAAMLRLHLDQALGLHPDIRTPHILPARIESRLELPVPRHDIDVLLFAASRLFSTACGQLAAAHGGIEHCVLELEHEHSHPSRLDIRTGTPTREAQKLASLTREHLARLSLPAPVSALKLRMETLVLLAGRDQDMFGRQAPSARDRQEACQVLVERLRARLGRDAVHGLTACSDHRPEQMQRVVDPGQAAPGAPRARRPLWLLAHPEPLTERHGQPWYHGPLECIGAAERLETGWWEQAGEEDAPGEALRDYWIARGRRGEQLWIFREHTSPHRWFLHGVFS
ncbi:Y-family DNA polymerase [Methyloversatilis thermotolerans]|uniref:Y-family DNA polymerase n=1 Tax=Methyloversatilis thermotolerans TaxID=1346290 RepID=UPI00037B4626|nr:DNA polymerase Y family protein [Methyloversatilis thermotolerans]